MNENWLAVDIDTKLSYHRCPDGLRDPPRTQVPAGLRGPAAADYGRPGGAVGSPAERGGPRAAVRRLPHYRGPCAPRAPACGPGRSTRRLRHLRAPGAG